MMMRFLNMNKWVALTVAFALFCASAYAGKPYGDSDVGKAVKNTPPLTGSALKEYQKAYEAKLKPNDELIKVQNTAIDYMEKAGLLNGAVNKEKLKTAELVVYEGGYWRNPGSGETRPMSTGNVIVVDQTYMNWVMKSGNEEAKNIFYAEIAHELAHFALRKIGGIQEQGNLGEAVGSIVETRVYNVITGKNLDVVNAERTGYADRYLENYVGYAWDGVNLFGKNFTLDQIHGDGKGRWDIVDSKRRCEKQQEVRYLAANANTPNTAPSPLGNTLGPNSNSKACPVAGCTKSRGHLSNHNNQSAR